MGITYDYIPARLCRGRPEIAATGEGSRGPAAAERQHRAVANGAGQRRAPTRPAPARELGKLAAKPGGG
jgi:hypothetical protein